MPCLEELKARGTTWNAQWKGLTGHLFGIEKKCVGKILWMHPSLGPGPCSTNWKMYKNTGLEQIKTSQKYPTHQQLYAKKHIGVLNTTSSICSVASRQKVFVMPSATQPLLYHAKNGRGESLDSNTSLNVLLSNLRHYIGKKKPSLHAYICPALQEECVWCARSKHSFNLNWNCCSVESSPWGGAMENNTT